MTNEPPHTFMASEMAEQPEVLGRLVARASSLRELVVRIAPRPLAGCAIAARGSSDHAALLGRYLFEVATGRPVSLVSPSVHTLYRAKVDYKGMLVLGVSQSGATPEIVEVLERLRDAGARTVALTDDPTSPLAAVAEEVVDLDAGPERAVPATKTVTATMLACILLAEGLADHSLVSPDALDALPEAVDAILADDSAATAVATQMAGTRHLATVARGYLFGAAIECALKIRETTGILANGWSAADLRHGPVAAIGPDVPILSLRVAGPAEDDVRRLEAELAARNARIFTMTDAEDADLPLPAHIPEPLASIPAVVRGQQLAFSLSTRLGIDPDQPLGLHKVTQT
ncbi:MAG: SIS domain-containing protein [Candidatus Limnocylindria bacterium]